MDRTIAARYRRVARSGDDMVLARRAPARR
jgi:hypothetical protein